MIEEAEVAAVRVVVSLLEATRAEVAVVSNVARTDTSQESAQMRANVADQEVVRTNKQGLWFGPIFQPFLFFRDPVKVL